MNQCSHIRQNGERCTAAAKGSHGGCWHHDRDFAADRVRNASRGGRGKVNKETRDVKKLVDRLTERTLEGEIKPAVVHAVVALQNIKLRAIEVEHRIDEANVRGEFDDLKSVLAEHGVQFVS